MCFFTLGFHHSDFSLLLAFQGALGSQTRSLIKVRRTYPDDAPQLHPLGCGWAVDKGRTHTVGLKLSPVPCVGMGPRGLVSVIVYSDYHLRDESPGNIMGDFVG